jgi:hypothetical protein
MKIAGFSFIRNAEIYDYPIVEAIQSILPICDEIYIAVGNSEDNTYDLVKNIDENKIKIIQTVWNDQLREGGKVLADETNKAFQAIPNHFDWCFYIQGDEVFHEEGLELLYSCMKNELNNPKVEGFLMDYLHHYGSYDYIATSRNWYRREIRVIRNNKNIISWKDAQGFRWSNQKKLSVKHSRTTMHHYGWVKSPDKQLFKQKNFNKYWHDDQWIQENIPNEWFDYSNIDRLELFQGNHPKVMQKRIKNKNWKFEHDLSKDRRNWKTKFLDFIEKKTGIRLFEYKNYILIE